MKLHELKEFTLFYILEHDSLTKKEKLQLAEFVKGANEDQVNYLLATGEALSEYDITKVSGVKIFPIGEKLNIGDIVNAAEQFAKKQGKIMLQDIPPEQKKKLERALINASNELQGKSGSGSSGTLIGIASAATAALIIFVSYKIYQNFFSKAAKACGQLGGGKKQVCMFKFRKKAYGEQIRSLVIGKKACRRTKDPKKCVAKIDRRISKLRNRLSKLGEA